MYTLRIPTRTEDVDRPPTPSVPWLVGLLARGSPESELTCREFDLLLPTCSLLAVESVYHLYGTIALSSIKTTAHGPVSI